MLTKNENLYMCGEVDSNLYVIRNGQIKTTTIIRSGKECLTGIYARGDIVGESCLLGGHRLETATAMTRAVLSRITRAQFLEALANEGLLEDCLRYLTMRLSEQQQVITYLVTVDSEQRLASTLLRLAQKLGRRHAEKLYIDQKITQEELSGMVGTTRSRVGLFLKKFREYGLIENSRECFLVVNEERLARYLEVLV